MTVSSKTDAVHIEMGSLCFLERQDEASAAFRSAKATVMVRDLGRLIEDYAKAPPEVWHLLRHTFDEVLGAVSRTGFLHEVDYFLQCLLADRRASPSRDLSPTAQAAIVGLFLALQNQRFQRHRPLIDTAWPLRGLAHLSFIDQAYLSTWTWNASVANGTPRLTVDVDHLQLTVDGQVMAWRTLDSADRDFAFVDAESLPAALLEEPRTRTLPRQLAASRFRLVFSWGSEMWSHAAQAIGDATSFIRGTDCPDQDHWQSGSAAHEPGSVYVTLRESDYLHAFEGLLHEAMHQRIYLLERVQPLVRHAERRYRHKWRTDDRPIRGVLLAAHAFAIVARFYAICLETPDTPNKDSLHLEFESLYDGVAEAVHTLRSSNALTETGTLVTELISGNQDDTRRMVSHL
jgi:HEXXH motif-containing protein